MSSQTQMPSDFEREAGESRTGLVAEFADFLRHNKKWWLLPILVVMAGVAVLVILGSTGAAPFIYTLF
ncbi:MAG: DUF5989 family protein [Phycisphaerae bacterium]